MADQEEARLAPGRTPAVLSLPPSARAPATHAVLAIISGRLNSAASFLGNPPAPDRQPHQRVGIDGCPVPRGHDQALPRRLHPLPRLVLGLGIVGETEGLSALEIRPGPACCIRPDRLEVV